MKKSDEPSPRDEEGREMRKRTPSTSFEDGLAGDVHAIVEAHREATANLIDQHYNSPEARESRDLIGRVAAKSAEEFADLLKKLKP